MYMNQLLWVGGAGKDLRGVWFCRWKNLECREITKNKGFELANQ